MKNFYPSYYASKIIAFRRTRFLILIGIERPASKGDELRFTFQIQR
jgi:hypothetical protein